jgi:hypothetical protein
MVVPQDGPFLPDRNMAGTDHADGLRHETIGFGAWRAVPGVMPLAHTHTDIELNFLLGGGARYFLAGRFHELAPGRLAVFWAGMPHRLVQVLPDTSTCASPSRSPGSCPGSSRTGSRGS